MDESSPPPSLLTEIISRRGERATGTAPDGSQLEFLLWSPHANMTLCSFGAGTVSQAVRHRTVHEFWYFLEGEGEIWMDLQGGEQTLDVGPGTAVQIPVGRSFQIKAGSRSDLRAVFVTMPPWPGKEEAELVKGIW